MHRISRKSRIGRHRGPFTLVVAGLLASACGAASSPEPEAATPTPRETAVPVESDDLSGTSSTPGCLEDGRLSTSLYGAVEGDISWQSTDMSCEGMPRPGGAGARLRFAGPHPSGDGTLVFIAAIPELKPDRAGDELVARLTVIEEGRSRFFTSPDFDICWADILRNESVEQTVHTLSGRIYCIAPINEVNGSATITVGDITFAGRIDWSAS